jgi:hypothetical protein
VLRNTDALLSMTLPFSAAIAAACVAFQLPAPGILLTLGGYFGLLFAVYKFKNSGWALPGSGKSVANTGLGRCSPAKKDLHSRASPLFASAFFGSPTWARTRDLRINRADLHTNLHRFSPILAGLPSPVSGGLDGRRLRGLTGSSQAQH